jgi:hypothetical protein
LLALLLNTSRSFTLLRINYLVSTRTTIPKIFMRLIGHEIVIHELTQVDKDKFDAKKINTIP